MRDQNCNRKSLTCFTVLSFVVVAANTRIAIQGFGTEVRMFPCFDKASCHMGTANIDNCKFSFIGIVVKKYIAVCERLANNLM